jgi:hypothetical protein
MLLESIMKAKKCQMVVAENYLIALKKCHVKDTIRISEMDLIEEQLSERDLARSCLISLNKKFDALESIWLNDYHQGANNEYHQGRIEGSIIPDSKMTQLVMLLKTIGLNEIAFDTIGFSYFDDNDNLCGFTLSVLLNYPSIWCATVTINTTAPADQRQLTVFVPEFSTLMIEDNPIFNTLIPQLRENIELDGPHLIAMESLKNYLGYSLNSHFIKYFVGCIFDKDGAIHLKNFYTLKKSIKNEYSMFDFPNEMIDLVSRQCELNQLFALLTNLRITSENTILFDEIIDLIYDAITDYSTDKYTEIKSNTFIKSLGVNYSQSKSRELEETFHSNVLFPKKNYGLQYARLSLLLGTCPSSNLKTEVKLFQQKINDIYLHLNQLVGLKKESLAKDLNILGNLLMNPSTENFKKYEERIKINEKASNNRELGGHIMTSSTVAALGVIAAGVTFTSIIPIAIPIITLGFFGVGGSGAIIGYNSANKRVEYKSELQDVEIKLIASNPKEWVLSKLTSILVKNKDGINKIGVQMIMALFQKTKNSTSLDNLSNSLAQVIFSLNEIDSETANDLRAIRELLQEIQPLKLLQVNPVPLQQITDYIEWMKKELKRIDEDMAFSDAYVTKEIKEEQIKSRKETAFVLHFNTGILQSINDLISRKTNNSERDEILNYFLKNINGITNKDNLITHLDNAIFALFDNSKNSKIGNDLLELRNSFASIEEKSSINPMFSPK